MPNHMTTSGFHVSQVRVRQTTVRHMFTRGRGRGGIDCCLLSYFNQILPLLLLWPMGCALSPCVCVCVCCGLELSVSKIKINDNDQQQLSFVILLSPGPGPAKRLALPAGSTTLMQTRLMEIDTRVFRRLFRVIKQ